MHQLLLVPPSPLCSSDFFSTLATSKYLSLFVFFDFKSVVHQDSKVRDSAGSLFSFCFWLPITRSSLLAGIVSQHRKEFGISHSLGRILVCACTI